MPTWTTADKSALVNSGDGFSDTCTSYNGNVVTVYGALEYPYTELTAEGIPAEGRNPTFFCALADVPAVVQGLTITINSTGFTISGVEPDGTGMVKLQLRKT